AEYWKSNAKHFCRFCKLYITDNKATRNIHDSGTKHKENVERFLREQNQRGRQRDVDAAKLNKQMDDIEKAAMKQYQLDIEAGLVSSSLPQPSVIPSGSNSAAPATESESGLGSTPPSKPVSSSSKDEPTAPASATGSNNVPLASKKVKPTPKETRPTTPKVKRDETIGQPGEWQTTESTQSSEPREEKRKREEDVEEEPEGEEKVTPSRESVADNHEDEETVDPEDLRGFQVVEKTYPLEDEDLLQDKDGDASSGAAMFKKRKGGAAKARNIRKRL
ncbi:WW domain binding protein 4, partial [Lunasporangiospora selenospora]